MRFKCNTLYILNTEVRSCFHVVLMTELRSAKTKWTSLELIHVDINEISLICNTNARYLIRGENGTEFLALQ